MQPARPDPSTKIFFCDFDGTLATTERTISPATRASLDAFVQRGPGKGNIFVLSSGRAMSDVKNLHEHLGLDYPNMFLAAWNGGELYSCETGETFFRRTLPFEVVRDVMQLSRQRGLYCQTYDESRLVIPEWGKETDYYTGHVKMPVRVDPMVRTDPHRVLSGEPCKCLVIHLENAEDHALEPFGGLVEERFGDTVRTILSNPWYLEVDPVDATKGNALLWLCDHLGIDPANAIAAGDAPNDNSMLAAAGIGIGMCNGLPSNPGMREAADIITDADNDHDGLAAVLDTL